MNASTALARVIVDELVRGGVAEAVLAPGSRNAPLSFALYEADRAGRLRLHVRIDERTAGFLALGLAKVSGSPVPVVCTSGTAVANLHPAVLEAHHSGVPVLALTADRPPELRGTGANQATDQPGIFGSASRYDVDLGVPENRARQVPYWRSTVCRALAAALGRLDGDPGPVHLNLSLREPLVPAGGDWPEPLDGRAGGGPWVRVPPAGRAEAVDLVARAEPVARAVWAEAVEGSAQPERPEAAGAIPDGPARTLVILGDGPRWLTHRGAEFASARGWPVIAEPTASRHPAVLRAGTLLLGAPDWLERNRPDRLVVVGRPTLSRAVATLLRNPGVEVELVPGSPRWPDPGHVARRIHRPDAIGPDATGPAFATPVDLADSWLADWSAADRLAGAAADDLLASAPGSGLAVARDMLASLPPDSLLVLGSSQPIRDVDLVAAPRPDLTVIANRGLAGIDGTVSTAVGAALAQGRATYALLGDLTFLHDSTGLVIGPDEPRPELTIVVLNNDGGGIFGLLEQGRPEHAPAFERVFGTPHHVDLAALCAATGARYLRAEAKELPAALAPEPGIGVIEIRTDRHADRELHERLRTAVTTALA